MFGRDRDLDSVCIWLASLLLAVTLPYWRSSIEVMGLSSPNVDPVYRGDPSKPYVSFAINVDWGQEVLPAMFDVLRDHDVKGTFFVTGRWARLYPELVRQMVQAGHEVANHGMQHHHPKELGDWELTMLLLKTIDCLPVSWENPLCCLPPYGR